MANKPQPTPSKAFERKDAASDRKQGIKENSPKDIRQDKRGK